jgi:hypothetical protein
MAKAYILNIKDTSGNWVGIPTLIGQKGEKGLNGAKGVDGVGITNITQQDKKLIIDLSNNTRKEFTIPSADLPNGVDILTKITREVPTNSPSITNFKTHLNIPSTTDIKTVKDLSFIDNKLKLTMNDESSKEVTIKSGIALKVVFDGELIVNRNSPFEDTVSFTDDYKICLLEFESESFGQTTNRIISIMKKEVQVVSQQNFLFRFKIENNKIKTANESPYEEIKITKVLLLI